MSEHLIQYQISQLLNSKKILHFSTDSMSGLQFFSHKDNSRYSFISHHKKMGYLSGVSDMILVLENRIVFVEIKNGKSGRQSESQKAFQQEVEKRGFEYLIWRSLDDAINFVKGE